jgi:hypothetical protein
VQQESPVDPTYCCFCLHTPACSFSGRTSWRGPSTSCTLRRLTGQSRTTCTAGCHESSMAILARALVSPCLVALCKD